MDPSEARTPHPPRGGPGLSACAGSVARSEARSRPGRRRPLAYSAAVRPSWRPEREEIHRVVDRLEPTGGQVDERGRADRSRGSPHHDPAIAGRGAGRRAVDLRTRRQSHHRAHRRRGTRYVGPPSPPDRVGSRRSPSSPGRGSPRSGRTGGRPSAGAGPARPGADRRRAARRRTRCPRRAPRRRPRPRAASGGPAGTGVEAAGRGRAAARGAPRRPGPAGRPVAGPRTSGPQTWSSGLPLPRTGARSPHFSRRWVSALCAWLLTVPHRDPQQVGHLLLGEVLEVAQHDHRALPAPEPHQRLAQDHPVLHLVPRSPERDVARGR